MDIGRLMYKSLVNIVNKAAKKGEKVEFLPVRRNTPALKGEFVRAYRNLSIDNGPAMVELQNNNQLTSDKISFYRAFRIFDGKTVKSEYKLSG
jgi:hypothetical protein